MGKDVIDDQYGRMFKLPFELSQQNINVSCFSLSYQEKGYYSRPLNSNLHWTSIDTGVLVLPGIYKLYSMILDHIHHNKLDYILATSDVIHLGLGRKLSSKTGIPLVTDLYDNFESFGLTRLPFMSSIYRKAIKLSRAITCVSRPLSEHIKHYCSPGCEILVLENAVDHTRFKSMPISSSRTRLSLPVNVKLIGTAGALYESRDIDTLFMAFKLLQERDAGIHLALAGRVERKVKLPELENVHYLGELSHNEVAYFYNALDLAIVPLKESEFGKFCFPQKASEILACKTPILAASVGVMKELLKDYPECLYDEGDVKMLARMILQQLQQPSIAEIVVPDWADQAKKVAELLAELPTSRY